MEIVVKFNDFDEMESFAKKLMEQGGKADVQTVRECVKTPAMRNPAVEKEEPKEEQTPEPKEQVELPFEEARVYTMEDVRKKLLALNKAGKKDEVSALIKSFGVDKFPQIPAEKYGELMAKAEAL